MNILVVSSAKFPEGDAEAVRLHTMGKLFRDIGHNVSYVCMGMSNYLEELSFDGFKYVSLRKKATNRLERIYYHLNYYNRLKKFLLLYLKNNKVDIILYADLSPITTEMLKKICEENEIQLLSDSVEWYSPEQFKFGLFSPGMILKNIENKYTIDNRIKVIAISKYLYRHFINKGSKCIRIPVILDVKNIPFHKQINQEKVTVLYAGSPGKKDFVQEMVKAVLFLTEMEKSRFRFILAGVSFNDIKDIITPEELIEVEKCVQFLGRVERKVVIEQLRKADFTLLMRSPEQRYAKAGFPTKVVESLATGTPVILNITSDLGDYIKDMEEGLIIKNCSAYDCAETLKRALALDKDQINIMKKNARLCAEKNFDYRLYKNNISKFLLSETLND